MEKEIIIALITGASAIFVGTLSLIGVIITNSKSNKSIEKKIEIAQAVTDTKLVALTEQVEKHNKVIERVYSLERADDVEKEQIKVINHRIDDLENYHK